MRKEPFGSPLPSVLSNALPALAAPGHRMPVGLTRCSPHPTIPNILLALSIQLGAEALRKTELPDSAEISHFMERGHVKAQPVTGLPPRTPEELAVPCLGC